ncbi:hypothetical protein ACCO45_012323 [Purpureocillium lilacinum]|uniref:Uncharacterized protein n=1 Tax=Purpureocillium lilacinum TaxID=33203 RepID=A0ACC4D7R8_PURLI
MRPACSVSIMAPWFEVPSVDEILALVSGWHDIGSRVAYAVATPSNIGVEPPSPFLPVANFAPERVNNVRSLVH